MGKPIHANHYQANPRHSHRRQLSGDSDRPGHDPPRHGHLYLRRRTSPVPPNRMRVRSTPSLVNAIYEGRHDGSPAPRTESASSSECPWPSQSPCGRETGRLQSAEPTHRISPSTSNRSRRPPGAGQSTVNAEWWSLSIPAARGSPQWRLGKCRHTGKPDHSRQGGRPVNLTRLRYAAARLPSSNEAP